MFKILPVATAYLWMAAEDEGGPNMQTVSRLSQQAATLIWLSGMIKII